MPTPIEQLRKVQDQILETIASFQKPVVETVGKVADRLESVVPETPGVPYGEKLPAIDEIVEAQFSFAEKLLAQQREFTAALLAALKPVSDKVGEAPKPKSTKTAAAA
jgi:hypothetical protein